MQPQYINREKNFAELVDTFISVRQVTKLLSKTLSSEDAGAQSAPFTSPAKWHLAHTSWFYEKFILEEYLDYYKKFNDKYDQLFNSYYNSIGQSYVRKKRGLITRPSLEEIYDFRQYVDDHVIKLIGNMSRSNSKKISDRLILGINHEQQHQELLLTDIKHLFFNNPLLPAYKKSARPQNSVDSEIANNLLKIKGGIYEIGATGNHSFVFDNETPSNRVFLKDYEIFSKTITNQEYLEFIIDGGYQNPLLWLSDGWDKKNEFSWKAPLYWIEEDNVWHQFTLGGLVKLVAEEPVCHVSFYEADAFARWSGCRLPTEPEWEISSLTSKVGENFLENEQLHPIITSKSANFFGNVWEWTSSSYLPYPGYETLPGSLGEYNGKFMINQIVLKGGSCLTPRSHIRPSYRNFFYPEDRWQVSGFRTVTK